MTYSKVLAYVNMYAFLGTLENLCELDPKASNLIADRRPISIGFQVKDGPNATIIFKNSICRMEQGCKECDIKLPFPSCEKFNAYIGGTYNPFPTKGFHQLSFIRNEFDKLVGMLNNYLHPTDKELENEEFFNMSTLLRFYSTAVAASQIGNRDEAGKVYASKLTDGNIKLSINGGPAATIRVSGGRLITVKQCPRQYFATVTYGSMELAHDIFYEKSGAKQKENAFITDPNDSSLDGIEHILDLVRLYI